MDLNKKLKELKPQQLNCNVFDVYSYNGLTMQDLLCQFFTTINECVKSTNEVIDLTDWLVNVGLEEEVVKKLMTLIEDGTVEELINVNLFDDLNNEINELSSQLEHKANANEVRLKDSLITEYDISDTLKSQMTGNTPINQIVGEKTVTPIKTTFFRIGKNLFNKISSTKGYRVTSSGQVVADDIFYVSEFIFVGDITGDVYKNNSYEYALFDNQKQFLSGGDSAVIDVTNATYIRINTTETHINSTQLERGSVMTEYEEYYTIIPSRFLEQKEITNDDLPVIKNDMLELMCPKSNLYNNYSDKNVTGKYISGDGRIFESETYMYSHKIKNLNYNNISVSNIRFITFFDVNNCVIGTGIDNASSSSLNDIEVPSNCDYFVLSFKKEYRNNIMCNVGNYLLGFDEYRLVVKNENLQSYEVPKIFLSDLYIVKGKKVNVYFNNIISNYDKKQYDVKIVCKKGMQLKDSWEHTATDIGTVPFTLKVYENNMLLTQKTVNLTVVDSKSLADKKIMFLGDSTTNQKYYPEYFKNRTGATLIGTRGEDSLLHEGRSGWTVKDYCTISSRDGVANPFFNNNTFDFSYYMTTQGYSSIDYVTIHLGINDIYSRQSSINTLNYFKTIINSIKSYSNNIKILLAITIPPNSNADLFGIVYGCSKTRWEYMNDYYNIVEQLYNISNVILIPTNVFLNCDTNFSDAVHPRDVGYAQMVDALEGVAYSL